MATLIMRSSEVDSLPAAVRVAAGLVRGLLVRRFEAVVSADPRPYLTQVAELGRSPAGPLMPFKSLPAPDADSVSPYYS